MRILFIYIVLFISILNASTFVDDFNKKQKEIIDKLYNGGNQEKLIEEKTELYNKFTNELKEKSYGISNRIKNDKLNNKIFITENKIKINSSRGNDLAVFRDKIKLKLLKLKKSQNLFYIKLAKILKNGKDENKKIESRLKYLNNINLDNYTSKINKIKLNKNKGKIEKETIDVYKKLEYELNREKDYLSYLNLKSASLKNKDLLSFLNLATILDEINSNEKFYKINKFLNIINLDVGKISLLFFMLFSFSLSVFLINFILKRKLNIYLEKLKIKNFDFEKNIKLISTPSKVFIIFFGIDFSVEILMYPNELNRLITNIFYFIHLFTITWLIIGFIDFFLLLYFEKKFNKKEINRTELINFLIKVIKFIAILIALLIYLNYLEVDITTIIASLGVTSLAVALAAKDTLSNLFGSINILLDNIFSQGDWIAFNDIEGTVVEIGMRSTTIRTFDNSFITVPNATLANSEIKNWNKRKIGRRIKTKIGVSYDSSKKDLSNAVNEIKEMLLNHPGIATSKTQFNSTQRSLNLVKKEDLYGVKKTLLVYFDEFNSSSLDILIYCFTKSIDWEEWLSVKQDVYYKIWEILEKNNLQIAFPTQTIELKKNNK